MKNTYQIDPVHSSVQFSIRHMMISNVRGTFTGVTGTVEFDSDNPTATKVNAEIDVSSLSTNDVNRDTHLKSADFFEVEKYPKMTFVGTQVATVGADEYRLTGNLTLHGVTKQVDLTVSDVTSEGKDPWGNFRIGATAKGQLNRKDFGLNWTAPLETGGVLVGDTVKLEFEVQLVRAQAASA